MFVILFTSNCIISYVGIVYVLQRTPFWEPTLFIPIIGMLLGNTMGSVVMATERCLDQISTHAALLETRLAYGATRYEAGLPLAIEIMRMAMLPVLTQLSVMGMINIPGMMTGQIMAGTPIHEAVMYQQCIMFMVAASSTFGVMMTVGVSVEFFLYMLSYECMDYCFDDVCFDLFCFDLFCFDLFCFDVFCCIGMYDGVDR
ncbi:hypothetical protein BDF14DRAFT_1728828 [Spinellus fusiger]|nr:hypothetical protein BDF14DRAFT_1728828 [Spinellus fusiger]